SMQIDAAVSEADIGGVLEKQNVDFTVDAYPTRTFHGEVSQVRNSPSTVNNVVTYDVVIGVTNADFKLKPGMTANTSIIVASRTGAIKAPNSALRFRPPDGAIIETNTVADPAPVAAASNPPPAGAVGAGGQHGGGKGGKGKGPRNVRTLYLAVDGASA